MTVRRFEQFALSICFVGACTAIVLAACIAIAHAQAAASSFASHQFAAVPYLLAQNPTDALTLPESPETPVSPTTPGTLPGTTAGSGLSVGTNPITGMPCSGEGSTALNNALPEADTEDHAAANPDEIPSGLPPGSSVFGLNSGAC
jgi:hypothetical protein